MGSTGSDEREQLTRVFTRFVDAVKRHDFELFRKLHHRDVRPELDSELFLKNAIRAEEHRFSLRLENVVVEGDEAELHFTVVPGDGDANHRDTAELLCARTARGWRIIES